MSDLFGNHIVGFPTRRLNYNDAEIEHLVMCVASGDLLIFFLTKSADQQGSHQSICIVIFTFASTYLSLHMGKPTK